jgi:hypothetical protein
MLKCHHYWLCEEALVKTEASWKNEKKQKEQRLPPFLFLASQAKSNQTRLRGKYRGKKPAR